MKVKCDWSGLKRVRWYEFALRVVLGGAICVIAGVLAKAFGPTVGGLFLAFPAIFPASATLVEKHESEKKRRAGIRHSRRGRQAAGLDAAGAAFGAVSLGVFAWVVYVGLPNRSAPLVIFAASVAWLAVAITLWWLRKKHLVRMRSAPTFAHR
jgi:hypothetical protein